MSIVLVNPNLVVQKADPLTTGVVYMPITLAYVAAALRASGLSVDVIDAYGEAPLQARSPSGAGAFWMFGLSEDEVIARVPREPRLFIVYAINLTNHVSTVGIVRSLKRHFPDVPLLVLENPNAVTAYALNEVKGAFFEAGADFILTGYAERSAVALAKAVCDGLAINKACGILGLGGRDFKTAPALEQDVELPYPAWDLFPLKNYWSLRFAHGPVTGRKYLPILTSRGCPYGCRFCVTPAVSGQHWHGREPGDVVAEMAFWKKSQGVEEFHFEDLNPTVSEDRIRRICEDLLARKLEVTWKLVSGTKAETIRDMATVDLMARAGCRYVSISPETGSARVLQSMGKPFDVPHGMRLLRALGQAGIYSQACFVLGFPGEEDSDRVLTEKLVREAVQSGVDEIALFVITPVPGSAIFREFNGYSSLSELNFSPVWRKDYVKLSAFRRRLYAKFLWWKLRYRPGALLAQPWRFLTRKFETKMEMVPYRAAVLFLAGSRKGKK